MKIEYDEGEEEERHKWYQWKLKPPPLGIKDIISSAQTGCRPFARRRPLCQSLRLSQLYCATEGEGLAGPCRASLAGVPQSPLG